MSTNRRYVTGTLTKRGRHRKARVEGKAGRKSLPSRDEKAICQRLKTFIRDRFGTLYEFVQSTGAAPSTVQGWAAIKRPRVPDTATLLWIARETGLSLDWLLVGEGGDLRGTTAPLGEVADRLRETIVAELAAAENGGQDQVARFLPEGHRIVNRLIDEYRRQFSLWKHSVFVRAKELMRLKALARKRAGAQPSNVPAPRLGGVPAGLGHLARAK